MQMGKYRRIAAIAAALLTLCVVCGAASAYFRLARYDHCRARVACARESLEGVADARRRADLTLHVAYLQSRIDRGWLFSKRDVFLGRLMGEVVRVHAQATAETSTSLTTPGHHVIATVSRVDGAHMPTSVTVPDGWDATTPIDAVLHLHSGGVDEMLDCFPAPAIEGAISFLPLARGSHDYLGVQMSAVEECVADVTRRFPVKRLFVMGKSMGGMGAWMYAQRHATEIAGVSPWCGNAAPDAWRGVWETERTAPASPAGKAWRRVRAWRTPLYHVEELRTEPQIPIYVGHGTADTKIPVGHSDAMVKALGEGPWLRYDRFEGLPHRLPPMYQERYEWLASRAPAGDVTRSGNAPRPPAPGFTTADRSGTGPACAVFERRVALFMPEFPSPGQTAAANELLGLWRARFGGALNSYSTKSPMMPNHVPLTAFVSHGPSGGPPPFSSPNLTVGSDVVTFFGHEFRGEDVGVILRRPLGDGLQVLGTTDASYRQIWTRFVNDIDWEGDRGRWWFDYAIYDRRTTGADTFLAVGFYDARGRFDPGLMFRGSDEARARNPGSAWPSPARHPASWLSQIPPVALTTSRGPVGFDRSSHTGPLSIQGETHERGVGMTPPCTVSWNLEKRYTRLTTSVGLARTGDRFPIRFEQERIRFEVWTDGALAAVSPIMSATSGTHSFDVDLTNVGTLELRAVPTTTQLWHYGPVGWAEASLVSHTTD